MSSLLLQNFSSSYSSLFSKNDDEYNYPTNTPITSSTERRHYARLIGFIQQDYHPLYEAALMRVGLKLIDDQQKYEGDDCSTMDDTSTIFTYRFNSAVGMLQLVDDSYNDAPISMSQQQHQQQHQQQPQYKRVRMVAQPNETRIQSPTVPRWIPLVKEKEVVLVSNGWSFLDADRSEPLSPFDIEAANREGLYRPKWGIPPSLQDTYSNDNNCDDNERNDNGNGSILSNLGYTIEPMSTNEIHEEAAQLVLLNKQLSVKVLLEGATDPPGQKETMNGYSFRGSLSYDDNNNNSILSHYGVFVCAIGGLPLFTTADLSVAATVSSGWLSFVRPISFDHIRCIQPTESVSFSSSYSDCRVEVVCAKSGCHIGHYFGVGEGYCINASALKFITTATSTTHSSNTDHGSTAIRMPFSYRTLENAEKTTSVRILEDVIYNVSSTTIETIVLGAGCFWHVEYALRRLPGVIETSVGYAGGHTTHPTTYDCICQGRTGHAEVVFVTFDSSVLLHSILLDCFFSMHDPTKVRAHGKQDEGTGQYRSCIFPVNEVQAMAAREALRRCESQLGKVLSTEIKVLSKPLNEIYPAEDYHQRYYEKQNQTKCPNELSTLSFVDWLSIYGKRCDPMYGSAQTIGDPENGTTRELVIAALKATNTKTFY